MACKRSGVQFPSAPPDFYRDGLAKCANCTNCVSGGAEFTASSLASFSLSTIAKNLRPGEIGAHAANLADGSYFA